MVSMVARAATQAIGLPPNVAACVPGTQLLGELRLGEQAARRDAAGQRLGQRHDVRLNRPVLEGVPLAGPAHAGLHFVEDQHQLVLVGQLAQAFEVAGRRQVDAALALDRLDHDGARLAVDQLRDRVEIAERGVAEAGQQRLEALVILRLAGRAQARPSVRPWKLLSMVTIL